MTFRTGYSAAMFAAALALAGGPALAQDGHSGHDAAAATQGSPASAAYRKAMDRMHEAMEDMEDSGDADVDFARGMIPHHQAAIDMAKAVLDHGSDPEIRQLAAEIVKAQEGEIRQLETWLSTHGK